MLDGEKPPPVFWLFPPLIQKVLPVVSCLLFFCILQLVVKFIKVPGPFHSAWDQLRVSKSSTALLGLCSLSVRSLWACDYSAQASQVRCISCSLLSPYTALTEGLLCPLSPELSESVEPLVCVAESVASCRRTPRVW